MSRIIQDFFEIFSGFFGAAISCGFTGFCIQNLGCMRILFYVLEFVHPSPRQISVNKKGAAAPFIFPVRLIRFLFSFSSSSFYRGR